MGNRSVYADANLSGFIDVPLASNVPSNIEGILSKIVVFDKVNLELKNRTDEAALRPVISLFSSYSDFFYDLSISSHNSRNTRIFGTSSLC